MELIRPGPESYAISADNVHVRTSLRDLDRLANGLLNAGEHLDDWEFEVLIGATKKEADALIYAIRSIQRTVESLT